MNIDRVLERLKPSAREIDRLAHKETEPALARSFEPLTPGPIIASLLLTAIAAAGIVAALLRFFSRGKTDER